MVGCLGQPARIDQQGSAAPASRVRIYQNGWDVTREATLFSYVPSGKSQPILSPRESELQNRYRYRESEYLHSTFTAVGELQLPENMGCEILIPYRNYPELTVVFTLHAPPVVRVTVLRSEPHTYHSYLGPGFSGHLTSLAQQLRAAGYEDRHEAFRLSVPAGADYVLVNWPPTPTDAYTSFPGNPLDNVNRPTGATYRFQIPPGLSVDHVNAMALPLFGHWQDQDQAGDTYLVHVNRAGWLKAPEVFLPTGVPYDSCMTHGGCSSDMLSRVYTTPNTLRIVYLRVERVSTELERVPLRMVGPTWVAPAPTIPAADLQSSSRAGSSHVTYFVYLAGVFAQLPLDDEDPAGCGPHGGCGWFTDDGRMVDYTSLP